LVGEGNPAVNLGMGGGGVVENVARVVGCDLIGGGVDADLVGGVAGVDDGDFGGLGLAGVEGEALGAGRNGNADVGIGGGEGPGEADGEEGGGG